VEGVLRDLIASGQSPTGNLIEADALSAKQAARRRWWRL